METAEDPGPPPILSDVLEDLAIRFVVNCPAEEQESFERLLFQVEAAFWFFEDEYREIWPHAFPTFNLLSFSQKLFQECALLAPFASKTKEIYDAFTQYKNRIPTCGAIILNHNNTKVLLVKGWKGTSWGFPKGKIDKDEDKSTCAVREVFEEVGFDISSRLDPDHYIERQLSQQTARLYIIRGVPEETEFVTQTKKEIGGIQWHKLKDLPTGKVDQHAEEKTRKFWMVTPFTDRLVPWLAKAEKRAKRGGKAAAPAAAPKGAPQPAPPKSAVAAAAAAATATAAGKKADKGKADSKADKKGAAGAPALQVLQRPEAAPPRRASRGHAWLDFEFKGHAVLAALG